MRPILIILSLFASMRINAQVQQENDSTWLIDQWELYVKALQADSTAAAQSRLNAIIEEFMVPLTKTYDVASVSQKRQEINQMVCDTTIILTLHQQQRIREIDGLLTIYESETRRMIDAFQPADEQLANKIKRYIASDYDGMMVSVFCKGTFTKWYMESPLPGFSQSSIPYLKQLALELNSMLADLSDEQKATPALLRQFMDTVYRVNTNYKPIPTSKTPNPDSSVMDSQEVEQTNN